MNLHFQPGPGFSNVLLCDLTEFEVVPLQINTCCTSTPPPLPLPQQSKRDPLGKRGFWVGVKLVKYRKKKRVKNHNLTCN